MSNRFDATYTIADGYANQQSRPHHFTIDENDIDDGMDDDSLSSLFMEAMEEDFACTINPEEKNEAEFISWAREVLRMRELDASHE